jgi:4-diphosphocytidyl-2-C-methyl-D-erythritol kinase
VGVARAERAPAKINLTLHIIGRRSDGYHDIESLVAFAGVGDILRLQPAPALALTVHGPTAAASGSTDDNLVLKAARLLARQVEGLKLGRFELDKRLPVAAGLGGGSADAAAALRLIARTNGIELDDPRLMRAARETGADVPVCLDPRARMMRGIGDVVSEPLALPKLPVLLVNPGVAVPTKDVFAALRIDKSAKPGSSLEAGSKRFKAAELLEQLAGDRNDLESPAIAIAPVIADVLDALRALNGCRLARMSGSGATCFGLFASARAAATAARILRSRHPKWWIRATTLG